MAVTSIRIPRCEKEEQFRKRTDLEVELEGLKKELEDASAMNEREEALVGTPHPNETPAQPAPEYESQMAMMVVVATAVPFLSSLKYVFLT